MILGNSTKWVWSYLLGCGKVNFEPRANGNLHRLYNVHHRIIPSLNCRSYRPSYNSVGHWAFPIVVRAWTGNLPILMWDLSLLSHSDYFLLHVSKWQTNGEKLFKNLQKGEGHFENYVNLPMLLLQYRNWNLLTFPPALSYFGFEHYS